MKTRQIDPVEAIRLYEEGRSWAEIGRILAEKTGRRSPFHGFSVIRAVRRYDRSQPRTLDPQSASHPR